MQQAGMINIAQFYELKDLLEDDFIDLINTYMKDSTTRLQEMQDAFEINDNRKGFEAAHSLKGASSNLGASCLTELCYELQEACRANKIKDSWSLIEQINAETHQVNAKINELLVTD